MIFWSISASASNGAYFFQTLRKILKIPNSHNLFINSFFHMSSAFLPHSPPHPVCRFPSFPSSSFRFLFSGFPQNITRLRCRPVILPSGGASRAQEPRTFVRELQARQVRFPLAPQVLGLKSKQKQKSVRISASFEKKPRL